MYYRVSGEVTEWIFSVKLIGAQCGREFLVFFLWLFNQENDVSLLTSLLPSAYLFGQASDEHYKLPSLLFIFVVSSKLIFFHFYLRQLTSLTVHILSPKFISLSVPSSGYSMIQNFEHWQHICIIKLASTSSSSYHVRHFNLLEPEFYI